MSSVGAGGAGSGSGWSMLPSGPLNGSDLYSLRKKLKATRKQLPRGKRCNMCRSAKTKCDGNVPCSRCIGKGCAEKCQRQEQGHGKGGAEKLEEADYEVEGAMPSIEAMPSMELAACDAGTSTMFSDSCPGLEVVVHRTQSTMSSHSISSSSSWASSIERPISATGLMNFGHGSGRVKFEFDKGIPHRLSSYWNTALNWKLHNEFFEQLTPACKQSVYKLMDALLAIVEAKKAGMPIDVQAEMDKDKEVWGHSERIGFLSMYFDTESASRVGVYMNRRRTVDFDCRVEEALSKSASNDLPFIHSEWSYFRNMVQIMCKWLSPTFTRYVRCQVNSLTRERETTDARFAFVRMTFNKVFTAEKHLTKVTGTTVEVDPAEYEAALSQDIELVEPFSTCPGWCMPGINSQQQHSISNVPEVETLAAIRATEEGRKSMDAMAVEIMRRGREVFDLADKIRQERAQLHIQQPIHQQPSHQGLGGATSTSTSHSSLPPPYHFPVGVSSSSTLDGTPSGLQTPQQISHGPSSSAFGVSSSVQHMSMGPSSSSMRPSSSASFESSFDAPFGRASSSGARSSSSPRYQEDPKWSYGTLMCVLRNMVGE